MITQPAGEHHTGTLNLAGQGNPGDSLDIPIAAIEAVTNAFYEDGHNILHCTPGDDMYATARTALEAAYPAIRQQVAEQIAAKANAIAEQYQASAVAHRDISIEAGSSTPKGERHMRTGHAFRNKAEGAWMVAHAALEIGGEA